VGGICSQVVGEGWGGGGGALTLHPAVSSHPLSPLSLFPQEIPLSDVLQVKSAREFSALSPGSAPHSFELLTDSDTLYVGQNLHVSAQALTPCRPVGAPGSSPAGAWEGAIRQAMMPVTLQPPPGTRRRSGKEQGRCTGRGEEGGG